MKKNFFWAIAIITTLTISSCQKDELPASDTVDNNTAGQTLTAEEGRLVSSSLVKSVPFSDAVQECKSDCSKSGVEIKNVNFTEVFKASFLGQDIVDFEIATYTIKYKSVVRDESGFHPSILTGAVSLIVNRTGLFKKRHLESISLVNTMFSTSAQDVNLLLFYFKLRSIYNAVVVFPFYQGGDAQDGNVVNPSETILKGRQAIDCELAALELVKNMENVSMMPCYYTENIGVCNGGGPALAVQYLLENDCGYKKIADKINLKSTYIGAGNLTFTPFLPNLLNLPEYEKKARTNMSKLASCAYISTVAGAYTTWKDKYFSGIELEDYFSEEFLSYKDKTTGMNQLQKHLANKGSLMFDTMAQIDGPEIFKLVNPNLLVYHEEDDSYTFNTEEGSIINNLYDAFAENDFILSCWRPKAPLLIAHSLTDEFVPFEINYEIWKELSNSGKNTNVTFKTADNVYHSGSIYSFMEDDILAKKHPVETCQKAFFIKFGKIDAPCIK